MPNRNGGLQYSQFIQVLGQSLGQDNNDGKIMVVAPTTAVPINTGLAVALKVLPAPSLDSR